MFHVVEKDMSGYKLFDFGSWYELHSKFGVYRGTLRQVSVYAVIELGFEVSEIEIGVLEMEKHFHDAAEYGIMKKFIYSFNLGEKYAKRITRH